MLGQWAAKPVIWITDGAVNKRHDAMRLSPMAGGAAERQIPIGLTTARRIGASPMMRLFLTDGDVGDLSSNCP